RERMADEDGIGARTVKLPVGLIRDLDRGQLGAGIQHQRPAPVKDDRLLGLYLPDPVAHLVASLTSVRESTPIGRASSELDGLRNRDGGLQVGNETPSKPKRSRGRTAACRPA